jgi:mRNA interferase MazF
MSLHRGAVCLARFPHAAGGRGKKRPVVVVQADVYNQKLHHVIVAEVTTNLAMASDPANLLIDISTSEGQATGLRQDSVVTCLHLVTLSEDRVGKVIGITVARKILNTNPKRQRGQPSLALRVSEELSCRRNNLSAGLLQRVDGCLKASLGLP